MRIGIEKLAFLVDMLAENASTIGDLAQLLDQTPERIQDAIDVLKIRQGVATQIPAVPWGSKTESWSTVDYLNRLQEGV